MTDRQTQFDESRPAMRFRGWKGIAYEKRPTLVGPTPKFPKVQCANCDQIYQGAQVVPSQSRPCPNCGCESFASLFECDPNAYWREPKSGD